MIDEDVALEGAVLHPVDCGIYYALNGGDQRLQLRNCSAGIDDYAISAARAGKIALPEIADLHRRIHELVIVLCGVRATLLLERSANLPAVWEVTKFYLRGTSAFVVCVEENVRQVQECMTSVELCSVRIGTVSEDFVFDAASTLRAVHRPTALVESGQFERSAACILSSDPVYVLSEITDLIKGVPHGKLQFPGVRSRRKFHGDSHQMALRTCQRNDVVDGCLRQGAAA